MDLPYKCAASVTKAKSQKQMQKKKSSQAWCKHFECKPCKAVSSSTTCCAPWLGGVRVALVTLGNFWLKIKIFNFCCYFLLYLCFIKEFGFLAYLVLLRVWRGLSCFVLVFTVWKGDQKPPFLSEEFFLLHFLINSLVFK